MTGTKTTHMHLGPVDLVRAQFKDSHGEIHYADLSPLVSLGAPTANRLINAYNRFCATYNSPSEGKKLRQLLRHLGHFAANNIVDLSTPESVYSTLHFYRTYWYTTETFRLALKGRNDLWYLFLSFLRFCMAEHVLPLTMLPPGNNELLRRKTLDDVAAEEVEHFESLVPLDLSRSDDAYLADLHSALHNASDAFLQAAMKEIAVIRSMLREGEQLLASTSKAELDSKIQRSNTLGHYYKELLETHNGKRWVHIFSPRHPEFKANLLTYITHYLYGIYDGQTRRGRAQADARLKFVQDGYLSDLLAGHLGVLTTRRAVPFFVFLLITNPNLTVEALLSCDAYGRNGIQQILAQTGESGNEAYLSVKKMRSHATKTAVLNSDAKEIVNLLLRLTQPSRDYLKRIGSPHANKLWVAVSKGGTMPHWMSHPTLVIRFGRDLHRLNDPSLSIYARRMAATSFMMAHPTLFPYIEVATLKLLRMTQGVLKWFETDGDVQQVALTLGNTTRVSLRHYIPKTLQLIMNKRRIRRFQNLLLTAATAGSEYMLDVSDFRTQEQLHEFLSQMLSESRSNDTPIIEVLRSTIAAAAPSARLPAGNSDNQDKTLYVSVSELNLAVLFLYQERIEGPLAYPTANARTSSAPMGHAAFFCGLSRTLRHVLVHDPSCRDLHPIYERALRLTESLRVSVRFS